MKTATRLIGADSVRMVELGHPWIIADAFTKKWPAGNPGDLVDLIDQQGRYLATALLDPAERIVARIISREPLRLDLAWLKGRLESAIRLRRLHGNLGDTDAYRLVNAEGDRLPGLTVDAYAGYLMLQLYGNVWKPHLQLLTRALQELLSPLGIYEKTRPQKTRELEAGGDNKNYGRLLQGKPVQGRHQVRENGLNLLVSLEKGLDTGLFPDQRKNRRELMDRAEGKRVLNLFSYTGAFSVAAAVAGASRVTSVDVSPAYTDWTRANFEANRLNPGRHEFIVASPPGGGRPSWWLPPCRCCRRGGCCSALPIIRKWILPIISRSCAAVPSRPATACRCSRWQGNPRISPIR